MAGRVPFGQGVLTRLQNRGKICASRTASSSALLLDHPVEAAVPSMKPFLGRVEDTQTHCRAKGEEQNGDCEPLVHSDFDNSTRTTP